MIYGRWISGKHLIPSIAVYSLTSHDFFGFFARVMCQQGSVTWFGVLDVMQPA